MRLSRLTVVPAFVALTTVLAAASSPHSARATEVRRIRSHFDSVLVELTSRASGTLSSAQAANRAAIIDTLRAYQSAGAFPHNYDFTAPTPYFIDRKTGVLCAVANLLAKTGRRDIVDRVAATNNNVWVAQLAADTAFTGWLTTNGITIDEAARIQVPYVISLTPEQAARNKAYGVLAPLSLGGALITSAWNATGNSDGHRKAITTLGIVSGIGGLAAGALMLSKTSMPTPYDGFGVASALFGGASIAFSSRSMIHHHRLVLAERETEKRHAIEAGIAPTISAGARPRAGFAVSLVY